jgi:hypothetical protein
MMRLTHALGTTLSEAESGDAATSRPVSIKDDASNWVIRFGHSKASRELVISKAAPDGHCSGMFGVVPDTGCRYLVYRAVFRRRTRVAEQLFEATTRYALSEVALGASDETSKVAVVCELDSAEAPAQLSSFIAELARVHDLADGDEEESESEERTSFLDAEEEAQAHILWDIMLGAGPVEKDVGIRVCASVLRDSGALEYKRLDAGGRVYATIENAINSGVKEGIFDRPSRGYVRAVQKELDSEGWRHCLLTSLDSDPIVREEVIAIVAKYAKEYFGVEFERLRRGGRIEKAVKSAINSCIRRGLVADAGRGMICRNTVNQGLEGEAE